MQIAEGTQFSFGYFIFNMYVQSQTAFRKKKTKSSFIVI